MPKSPTLDTHFNAIYLDQYYAIFAKVLSKRIKYLWHGKELILECESRRHP